MLGELADNSHKSSDLGEKLLVNMEWNLILQDKPPKLIPELSIVITLGFFSGEGSTKLLKPRKKM